MARKFPRLILFLLCLRLFRSSETVLGDLIEEYNSGLRSRRWLWRQVLSAFVPQWRKRPYVAAPHSNKAAILSSVIGDIRYAARTLRHSPGFTAVAVFAIALGIGVNTGIFTVLNGAALRSLPLPGSARLVSVYQNFTGLKFRNVHGAASFFSSPEYRYYRDHNHVLTGLVAYAPFLSVTLGGERPQQLFGQYTSCNYFDVLNVPPAVGRTFASSDCDSHGADAVVVLSNDLWKTVYHSDPAIAGSKIILNRQPFTVAGVAPAGFTGTEPVRSAFWVPISAQPALEAAIHPLPDDNVSWLVLLGRMKPGVSIEQTRADLAVLAGRIDQWTPGRKTSLVIETATLLGLPEMRNLFTNVAAVILAAVGLVLLVACANVANLLLARAAGRQREIAIRLAVGAGRARLIRQLLTESLLISLAGGLLGSIAAFWSFAAITAYLVSHLPPGTPPLMFNVGPDLRVLGFSLALSIATGIVFGLIPAFQASRTGLNEALKEGGAGSGGRNMGFVRHALVGVQVAVSMVLLIAAGLLLRGLYVAQTVDPGFNIKNVAVVSFDLREQGYKEEAAAVFERRIMERIAALPGVASVAQAGMIPLSDSHRGNGHVEYNEVSPEFFALLGIPIVRGRGFTAQETRTGAGVAILTESTAARMWPGEDPIGKVLHEQVLGDLQVIGVTRSAQVSHLTRSNEMYLYLPAGPKDQPRMNLLVRGDTGFPALANGIRASAHALDPDLLVNVAKLEDNLEFWRMPSRIVAILSGFLGALALFLASIGVYGVVSYAVRRRIREIGIRMTLGASTKQVMGIIILQVMRPVVIGAVIGIAACAAVSRVLSSMLFGISAHDPVAFSFVPLFLIAVALTASYLPARRATRIDPMVALRYE